MDTECRCCKDFWDNQLAKLILNYKNILVILLFAFNYSSYSSNLGLLFNCNESSLSKEQLNLLDKRKLIELQMNRLSNSYNKQIDRVRKISEIYRISGDLKNSLRQQEKIFSLEEKYLSQVSKLENKILEVNTKLISKDKNNCFQSKSHNSPKFM